MADGVEVVLGVRIAALRASRGGFELAGEQGNTHGVVDAVIVSAPAPQAADLLEHSPERGERVAVLRTAVYDPAVMILAGFALDPPRALDPFALAPPFARVTAESIKGRGATDGVIPVVARIDPGRSAALLDASDADILTDAVPALRAICGAAGDPCWVQVKRWRYATLPAPLDPAKVNPPGSRIVVCGDTVAGGGLAGVHASGLAAAGRVIAEAGA
jgi:predicted NAD/FAD-dependent oxidoreductase